MSVRFAQDMVSVSGSFTTGSNMALSRRGNESRMRHMPLQSTTLSIDACENGSPTRGISIQHPQRKLYEVHYAKGVGIPSGRSPLPPGFGIMTRRTGAGLYVFS